LKSQSAQQATLTKPSPHRGRLVTLVHELKIQTREPQIVLERNKNEVISRLKELKEKSESENYRCLSHFTLRHELIEVLEYATGYAGCVNCGYLNHSHLDIDHISGMELWKERSFLLIGTNIIIYWRNY